MFEIRIQVNSVGNIEGKIIDLAYDEEYTNYRIEGWGERL